jgi:hypothetical protein
MKILLMPADPSLCPTRPEGEELGRKQKVHLVTHLLSGTHDKMGYEVDLKPKAKEITIYHQKGLEPVFWENSAVK